MLVIARAERDYLTRYPEREVAESCVHGSVCILRNRNGREVARYGFTVTPHRIKVWHETNAIRTAGDASPPHGEIPHPADLPPGGGEVLPLDGVQ